MNKACRHRARGIVMAGFGLVASAIALTWGWNRTAADLGGLAEVEFVHGVAAVSATAAIAGVVAIAARLVLKRAGRS